MDNHKDIVFKLQDLRNMTWKESGQTSGSGGTFLKSRVGVGDCATYFKLSCYDAERGIYGHECVNELIARRLADALGIPCARYVLVHALVCVDGQDFETWLTRAKSFRNAGQRKMPFDMFYDLMHKPKQTKLDLCREYGWLQQIQQMLAFDYLIGNRDRHGANIEIICDKSNDINDEAGHLQLTPLFDNGVSFFFSSYGDIDKISITDVLVDIQANNYLGGRSLEENLQLCQPDIFKHTLSDDDIRNALRKLEHVLSYDHIEALYTFIRARRDILITKGILSNESAGRNA